MGARAKTSLRTKQRRLVLRVCNQKQPEEWPVRKGGKLGEGREREPPAFQVPVCWDPPGEEEAFGEQH